MVSILGATGSIGCQTLDVISQHPDQFQIFALSAKSNVDVLYAQCLAYQPRYVVCVDEAGALMLRQRLAESALKIEVLSGQDALSQIASDAEVDLVVAAIVGAAGLRSTFSAVCAGKKVLLANKEALVMGGQLMMDAVVKHGATLLPVDSEHNALFQCMPNDYLPGQGTPAGVDEIILTASGGPFLNTPLDQFAAITPAQAVAHPNWSMGAKISVDSATMMNKGLEVIEAHWLFSLPAAQIDVLIHPQSTIHSLVRYTDGSLLAQCGVPDMRTPIANCLAWPKRITAGVAALDLVALGQLNFSALDHARFPCLQLAYAALAAGPQAVIALNIANEIAVAEFLAGKLKFTQIFASIERVLEAHKASPPTSLADVLEMEKELRV